MLTALERQVLYTAAGHMISVHWISALMGTYRPDRARSRVELDVVRFAEMDAAERLWHMQVIGEEMR